MKQERGVVWLAVVSSAAMTMGLAALPEHHAMRIASVTDPGCKMQTLVESIFVDDGDSQFEPNADDVWLDSEYSNSCTKIYCNNSTEDPCTKSPAADPPPPNSTVECDCASGDSEDCELKLIVDGDQNYDWICAGYCGGPPPTEAKIEQCHDSYTESAYHHEVLTGTPPVWIAMSNRFCWCP